MFNEIFLKEQKEKLLKQRADLEKQLRSLRSKKRRGFPFSVRFPKLGTDVDSDTQEIEQYESNLSLEKQMSDRLRDTRFAFSLMKKGRYGLCLVCGKEIEEERLRAYPAALTHANHIRPARFWQRLKIWPFQNPFTKGENKKNKNKK